MIRRALSTLVHIALLAVFSACDGGDEQGSRQPADAPFRVALLTPGPISDQSWNGGAYAGLLAIRDSLGAQISHVQTRTPAEFEENFRQYGAQGYDLVFGHGFEFQDAAIRVAPSFPGTWFVTTSGNTVRENVAGMRFAFEQASYLAGMLAADMSRSGTIGAIGGTELPPVKASFEAFANGARAVRPDIRIVTAYVGNWDDVSAGKEQALALITRQVDVIFQNADAAGLGVFQAAREATGVYVIGSNADQNGVAPDVTLGSVVINLPHAFLLVAREVKERRFQPRVVELGGREEVVALVLNPTLASRVPEVLRQTLDSTNRRLLDGSLSPLDSLDAAGTPAPPR